MTFPGFENLYNLSDPLGSRAFRGGWEGDENAWPLTRAEQPPRQPPVIPWSMGEAVPGDLIWTGMCVPLIISPRVVDVLQDYGLTGWQTYPVVVTAKDGCVCPGYHGLAITGRCGEIDPGMSEIILKECPGGWFPHFKGEYFPPDTWDGADFFMEGGGSRSGTIYVTFRVITAFAKAKIKNVCFSRMDDIIVDTQIYAGSSHAKLPADFQQRVDAA